MFTKEFIQSSFPKGKLSIVASRPAMGKTSFGISLASTLAQAEKQVVYFSLECDEAHFAERLRQQIGEKNAMAIGDRINICDTSKTRVSYIRSQLEQFCFDFVVIDYLQLMDSERSQESRNKELEEILVDLKELAAEQDLPIVVLSQLCRYISGIGSQKPYMSSLQPYFAKCLNDINVAFLYRPDYYHFYAKDASGKRLEGKMEFIHYVNDIDIIIPLHFNNETTKVTMMTTWGKLREEILNAPRWYVNIDMHDLKWFEGDNAEDIIVIESETTDTSENRLIAITESLIGQIRDINTPTKALIYIQFSTSSPLIMEVLKAFQDLMEVTVPSDCEYIWVLSPREDGLSRIVCAIH